ncbi:MAG: ParB/RepB/Spo0J family partition protein, partial [Clostridia bacterium]|nr:ParB/RepB/Spo0J family partition protein [Clostridia bacterium]
DSESDYRDENPVTGNNENIGAFSIKLSRIQPDKNQPRKYFDEEKLQELADNIKEYGVIEPIVVKENGAFYEIITGERRWRAARMAGLKEIPVVIKNVDDRTSREMSIIENIQREDLNPVEEALAYQSLIEDFNLTQEEVAKKVSKNRSTITNSLRLLKLDEDILEMLRDGRITQGHARALLVIEERDLRKKIADKCALENLSVREIEKLVKLDKLSKENKSKNINKNKTEPKLDLNKNKTVKKTKETISTTLDTLSPEKDKEKNILILNEDNNPNFARIPRLIRRQSRLATGTTFNAKDVEKAIKLRRKQYNEYLKNLNKPKEVKPEPVIESESSSSSESEPKVYDSNKVNTIQKIYRGYQNKKIYQLVDRLKINSCVTELLCLIFCRVFIHAKKRISFGILKTYYHVPFSNICEEMDFKDKIAIRLPDRYYNFKYLVEYEYYVL